MCRLSLQLIILGLVLLPVSATAQQCGGVERWPVKVGSDTRADEIDLAHPVPKSLHDLVSIAKPQLPSGDDIRLDQERTVYIVQGRLVKFKMESGRDGDLDYHLVISDDTLQHSLGGGGTTPSPHSFVAEIPKPECVPGRHGDPSTQSRFASQLSAVRMKFEQQFQNITGGWNDADGISVTITGIGFFDRQHGQVGRAVNDIELHPILDISFDGVAPAQPLISTTAIIQNPGFEDGPQNWTAATGVISDDVNEPARTGTRKAWLGGYGTPHTDTLYQQISIPSSATTASLSFYLHISTEEQTTTEQYDTLRVQLRRTNGQLIKNLATYSNLQASPGFSLKTLDVSAYRGQTARIYFSANEDNGSMTSFVLDDFSMVTE